MPGAWPASRRRWRRGSRWRTGRECLAEHDLRFEDRVTAVLIEPVCGSPDDIRPDADNGVAVGGGPAPRGGYEGAPRALATDALVHDQSTDLRERVRLEHHACLDVQPSYKLALRGFGAQHSLAGMTEEPLQPSFDLLERRGVAELGAERDERRGVARLNGADSHAADSLGWGQLLPFGTGGRRRVHRLPIAVDPVICARSGEHIVRVAVGVDRRRDAVQDIQEAVDLFLFRGLAPLKRIHLVLHRLHVR